MPRATITPELVASIVATPEKYGFQWYTGEVFKGQMSMGFVPLVKHLNTKLLSETFGDEMILGNMDGTSRHVTNQGIGRNMRFDNRAGATDAAIKVAIVENMLGKKAARKVLTVSVKVYLADDGTEFESKQEALDYNALAKTDTPTA